MSVEANQSVRVPADASTSVMLVDDDPVFVSLCEKFVQFGRYQITFQSYTDPEVALSAFLKKQPDVLLLDLNMPAMDGWDFIESLSGKKIESELHILTSSIDSRDKRRASMYPIVKGFLNKPLTRKEFGEILQKAQ